MVTFTIGKTPVHRKTSGTTLERKKVKLCVSQCVGKNSSRCMKRQAFAEWAGGQIENLHRAACPTAPLHEECFDAFRRQAVGERLAQVARYVALAQQHQAEQHVLGDRLRWQRVSYRAQRLAARYGVRSAAEGGVPSVATSHDGFEEEALIVGKRLAQGQIGLHRVMIVERVRNLNDPYRGIVEESHGAHEEIALCDEVCIEQRKIVGVRPRQCVVDIAGLGVRVVGTGDVSHALRLAKLL